MSQVCNETDAQLIMFKYKKNTIKKKRRASYRSEKIMCFSLKVLVSVKVNMNVVHVTKHAKQELI